MGADSAGFVPKIFASQLPADLASDKTIRQQIQIPSPANGYFSAAAAAAAKRYKVEIDLTCIILRTVLIELELDQ
jgi:hypothetical protein